jgi:glucose-6-phosphate 1-dehydrogenase
VQYKDAPAGIFTDIPRNELVMRIQPDEAVWLKMNSKLPGFATRAVPAELDLTYGNRFEDARIPQAYEALILDAFRGDHSNFVRDDELDVAWKIFTPILHWIDGKDGMLFTILADRAFGNAEAQERVVLLGIAEWKANHTGEAPKPVEYKYGSRGPEGLDEFTAKYGYTRQDED